MSETTSEIHNVCRACLTTEAVFQSIFVRDESVEVNIHLAEMIMDYTTLQITLGDGLPEIICSDCAQKCVELYKFKRKCESTDTTLRSLLNLEPIEPPVQIDIKNEIPPVPLIDFPLIEEEPPSVDIDDSYSIPEDKDDVLPNEIIVETILEEIDLAETNGIKLKRVDCKAHYCDYCGKRFRRAYHLSRHLKTHKMKSKITPKVEPDDEDNDNAEYLDEELPLALVKLELCNSELAEINLDMPPAKKEIKKKRGNLGKAKYECHVCRKRFSKSSHLTRHSNIHLTDKPHVCYKCNKTFARMEQLNLHMNVHLGVKPHACKICAKAFNQKSNLKDHMRTHNGEKPFLCSTCGKGFNQLGNLRQHTVRHTGIKAHLCSVCGNGFASKGELGAHLRKHTGARPFVCPTCQHGFTTSSSLTKHKRIHSGEKPYECEVCHMKFSRSGILARHKRTHTGEKPYRCKFCNKAFSQSNDLSSHLRIHTGEKPYVCDVCTQPFRQSSALKTHKKTHMDRSGKMTRGGATHAVVSTTTTTATSGADGDGGDGDGDVDSDVAPTTTTTSVATVAEVLIGAHHLPLLHSTFLNTL